MRDDNKWIFRIKYIPVGPTNLILEKILDDRNSALNTSTLSKESTQSKSFKISLIKKKRAGRTRRTSSLQKKF